MNPYFPHLFSPLKVRGVTYRNRIFMAPTALKELTDHNYIDYHTFEHLERRALGGAASVALGEGIVHETGTVEWSKKLHLWEDRAEPGIYTLATKIRSHGAVPTLELNHAGMHFHDDNRINYGPSDCVDTMDQGDGQGKRTHKIVAMPKEVIEEVVEAYGKAAYRAKHCGFQAVLLHAGHGWLLAQFFSPILNQRTDEFGGSLENRARLACMVVDRIRQYCGPNFVIEARVSWMEGLSEGYGLEESIEFCKLLEAHGVDLIHITAGSLHYPETTNFSHPSWFDIPDGKNVEQAAEIKKHLHIPVGTVGACTDPHLMEQWIAEGKLDYVVCARALVADPDLPKKAMHGQTEDIRPCLRCISCLTGGYYDLPMHCSVNPIVGRDSDFKFVLPPAEKKRVLIAGGGPAGMQCALTAAQRGHEVILCEKSDHLGGLLPVIEIEPFKVRIKMYREWLERQIAKSAIDVRLNTEVTPELVAEIRPDKLIAAVGADPINAPIPGIDKATNIVDFYKAGMPETGETVTVIGGGFAGVECAIGLAQNGKKVTVIEMCDAIASGPNTPYPGTGAMQIDALWFHANKNHVDIRLNTKCVEVRDGGVVVCENKDGTRYELKADMVLSAGGMKPREAVVEALRDTVIDFAWVGDCYAPGLIRTAVEQGFNAAMDI